MKLDRDVRDRIAVLRFVMIFGIILLHTPPYVPMAEVGGSVFDAIKAFFQLAVFRATVPVLTVISGFLLFNAGLDRVPAKLFRKKWRSIVIPFLCFNLPLLPLAWAAQQWGGMTMSVQLIPFETMRWLNAAFGLTDSPLNYPLNFLRDLIVLIALAPVFGWLLRRAPWLGLALVVLVFFPNLDGPLLLRDVMGILFYVGGMAAVQEWDLRRLDRYKWPCLLLFVAICVAVVEFRVANTTYLRLAAPILIWPASAWLVTTTVGGWLVRLSKYSFFLFLAHAPLLLATWLVYQRLGAPVPYPWYWVLTPWVVAAILIVVYRICMAVMPGLFSALVGTPASAAPVAGDAPPATARAVPPA